MTVGGVTEPPAPIVNRAGTRTLIEAVLVGVGAVLVSVAVVRVTVVCAVVVSGGVVSEAVEVEALELVFDPPQLASTSGIKRTTSPLTFAG